jgi:hypothetical protein
MSKQAISKLYNTVPHPASAYLGPTHSFRAADGGGNNLQDVNYGRAGTSYARSVQGHFCNPPTSLPDPGLIFDTLLKRSEVSLPLRVRLISEKPLMCFHMLFRERTTHLGSQASRSRSPPWSRTLCSGQTHTTGPRTILARILTSALYTVTVRYPYGIFLNKRIFLITSAFRSFRPRCTGPRPRQVRSWANLPRHIL